ncbi:hypothetical protein NPIL_261661, partial [Nephila pilipes]
MKLSLLLFLTTVWVFLSGCAQADKCRDIGRKDVACISL